MQVVLVRHGRPLIECRRSGIADPRLDPYGEWQAERVSQWLAHEPIDAIVTSPKVRAIETVAPLMKRLGMTNEVVADLDEIDRGAATYIPTDLLPTEGGQYWENIIAQKWDEIGWDSPEIFAARIRGAWDDLLANPRGEHVVVGCHGGTIRCILAAVIGEDSPAFHVQAQFASITRVLVENGHPRIMSANETGHFDADRIGVRGPMNTRGNLEP
ncbi:MAG: histidine phosphatase family protein [Acidimicrobiaceae bacterium]|jgi:2,3-bisphosphoglycerate-dependent phosphoglycerate mutase|nr:histidine phosphatase family protein [Acidimicrobiaceae bacterium]MBT5581617.1 histidine phosphatase family protein [Acidimicrobiaceae bacterium]